jgi:Helicase conserved C-terminal domain
VPRLVAEALVAVREPLTTVLRPGPPAPAAAIACALARSLAPPEARDPAPTWLWPDQVPSFRRALYALRRFGGGLLADPVGSGKTYVGLAVASLANGRHPTVCLVPATLVAQWESVARRLNLSVVVWSHERVSRGNLPSAIRGKVVLVDESHHFRNPATRRYGHLAPWLMGRQVLLMSASPVVNRLPDLAHQLALTIRDDALAGHGIPSLTGLLEEGRGHSALSTIIVARPAAEARRPGKNERVVSLDDSSLSPLRDVLVGVDELKLSTQRPVAGLVRSAFWRAAASSPAALAASLDRYQRLLQHAGDAARAGQRLDRRLLRSLTKHLDDQLLLWELLPLEATESELALEDLPLLERLRMAARSATQAPDPKLSRLAVLLADGRCSVVFTGARETVRYLRDRLNGGPIAWCTGERAGIGAHAAPRRTVLDWFRPSATSPISEYLAGLAPRHLIATDVAAEGLDLHRAERIIHYDLPWTPARLEQREGRACRAGAAHEHVEAVRFEPPSAVENRLRQLACLTGKRALPSAVGLDEAARGLWRWRVDLAERFRSCPAAFGTAELRKPPAGILAGFAILPWPGSAPLATWVLWWDRQRGWTEDPDVIESMLANAARSSDNESAGTSDPCRKSIDSAIARLAAPIRERMRQLSRSRWLDRRRSSNARTLIARLQVLARVAARRRDAAMLANLQDALRFAGGGHTAGEQLLITRLAALPNRDFQQAIVRLPRAVPVIDALQCRLTGLVVFSP